MRTAIEVSNLTVYYPHRPRPVVEDVSFRVLEDSITVLIGPNGSGKTTIIKAILGLIEYEGDVRIFGKPIQESYCDLGFVPQRFTFDLTFPITVEEFMLLSLGERFKSQRRWKGQVHQALEKVDAVDLKHDLLSALSGGQLQRVLLARALIGEPKLLILDEPEAGIDVGGEQTLYDLLEAFVDQKRVTVLVASHELDVVFTYADQVVCVNRRVLCSGVPREVLNQETFEQLYGRGLKYYGHNHGSK